MKKTNTTTRNKRLLRYGASALILTILFVFVFAGALTASFAVEENAIENGQLKANVAEASGNSGSTLIDLSGSAIFTNPSSTSAININPDVGNRGKYWSTDTNHTTNGTWTTGNGSTGGTWTIGQAGNWHTGTDYAHCWFDYDLGQYWNKLNASVTISLCS